MVVVVGLVGAPSLSGQGLQIELEKVATGLSQPILATHAGDGSGRLFIVEKPGWIRILKNGTLLPTPFLDVGSLVSTCNECGLLGLAFHSDYDTNGLFYISYTRKSDDASVLARYTISGNPDLADAASAESMLVIGQPASNHNGGHIAFGTDGYLYFGLGDGGGAGDTANNAQNIGNLLGTILRIDPEGSPPAQPNDLCGSNPDYGIPASNPFVGGSGDCDEIWAYGLRNPWRFSFDRWTGDLWIGDVGQDCREEIDFEPFETDGGLNYGWRLMEGSACFDVDDRFNCDDPPAGCNDGSLTLPVLGYPHASGFCNSVTGGYRYRGALEPQLQGVYLFGEFCHDWIAGTIPRCDSVWESRVLLDTGFAVSSFGESEAGEVYVVEYSGSNGKVHRIKVAAGSGGPLLTATPAPVDFGVVQTGSMATQEVLLTNGNAGREAVLVAEMLLSDEVQFELDVDGGSNPCGTETPCLAPGASCTVEVVFTPTQAALVGELLSFAGNIPTLAVGLSAKGCAEQPFLELDTLTIADTQQREACDWISVGPDVEVVDGGVLTLTAGTRVILKDGFSVLTGGRLAAGVDPAAGLP
jgi:hypothetical protein